MVHPNAKYELYTAVADIVCDLAKPQKVNNNSGVYNQVLSSIINVDHPTIIW